MLRASKYTRSQYVGLLYILPWIIGLVVFQAYPFIYSLILSFTNKTLSSNTSFVGLANYIRLFTRDRDFYKVCEVTLKYVLFAVPGRVLFALIIALLMNTNHRGVHFFRTLYYLPSIFGGSVAIAIVWRLMFQNNGVVNAILGTLGIDPIKWLGHPKVALTTITMIPVWQFGSSMVLFLTSLKNVPQELYEAGKIDGCKPVGMFFRITLPMISPILLFNLMMQMISCFQDFSVAFVMTGGGPNRATYLYGIKLYNEAFSNFNMGYASALSWVMFAAIMVITLVIQFSSRYWVFYNDGGQ